MHTQGPWEAVNEEIISPNSDANIADVYLHDGISPSEWQGNRRLIAAAPEMLDALHRIAAASGDPIVENIAKAAIAKAEGD